MINKALNILKKVRRYIVEYFMTNRLFISYVIISFLVLCYTRFLTLGEILTFRSFLANTSIILLAGSFGYLFKAKNRFNYYFFIMMIWTLIAFINNIYYKFFDNFASFGELETAGQTETVMGSIIDRMGIAELLFILFPLTFYLIHKNLKTSSYYNLVGKAERSKTIMSLTAVVGGVMLFALLTTSTPTDYSRLTKQWNRVINVERFGFLFYQFNDLVQTLTPRFSSLFGFDEALEEFNEYYGNKEDLPDNKYTGVLEGKNVVFVHLESIQTFLMDLEYNGVPVTPNMNALAEEGMFFNNFYPQISTGTSSDSEFSLLSGLYPAPSGTVFVSYYNRYYQTIPKILSGIGYNTFSMHGNDFSMWNRHNAHPSLGYEDAYFKNEFVFEEEDIVGLGINDSMFFDQAFDYLVEIENNNTNYMGTMITLSNHSPFEDVSRYIEYDLSYTIDTIDEDGNPTTITTDYLSEESIGRYLKSSHYADAALGEFINMIKESENFNDTLFVFYGDHDAKFSRSEIEYLYNFDPLTGELPEDFDELEPTYDSFAHDLNKKTPLIMWTKNTELKDVFSGEYDYPMGMIDISPTILNMMNLENEYALGKDVFSMEDDNYVIFPNGSFLTKDIYYSNSSAKYKVLNENAILSDDYIANYLAIVDKELSVSKAIVVHDLIEYDMNKELVEDEN